jgi:membrane-bound lytic murein transglycosylase D
MIQVPRDQLARPIETALRSIPESHRFAAQTRDRFHRVRRGETLSQISARYGVSMRELASLNGLRSRHRIRVGQKLRLPFDESRPTRASVQPRPLPADGMYTVRRGDNLSKIGRRFGLSPNEIARLNGLRNRNQISVGQRLAVSPATAPALIAQAEVPAVRETAPATPPTPAKVVAMADTTPLPEAGTAASVAPTPTVVAAQPVATPDAPIEVATSNAGPAAGIDEIDSDRPAQLLADPSNYSVDADDTIEVQATETLGHYADWLDLRASRLRSINGLRYGTPIGMGRRLQLDFSRIPRSSFERRRMEYHADLQLTFFEQYEIAGTHAYVTRAGDSLWNLAQREFAIPVWLLRQYNPDVDFGMLHRGTKVTVPIVKPHGVQAEASDAEAPTRTS